MMAFCYGVGQWELFIVLSFILRIFLTKDEDVKFT